MDAVPAIRKELYDIYDRGVRGPLKWIPVKHAPRVLKNLRIAVKITAMSDGRVLVETKQHGGKHERAGV